MKSILAPRENFQVLFDALLRFPAICKPDRRMEKQYATLQRLINRLFSIVFFQYDF